MNVSPVGSLLSRCRFRRNRIVAARRPRAMRPPRTVPAIMRSVLGCLCGVEGDVEDAVVVGVVWEESEVEVDDEVVMEVEEADVEAELIDGIGARTEVWRC